MRFFFFGSLLDGDVAELVLGRRLPTDSWRPATLEGYARVVFAKENYPVIVARPGGRVEGAVVRGLSPADHARIVWFEEGEYDLRPVTVSEANGRRLDVLACVARREIPVREGDWSLARWQREDKPAFMELVRLWMSLHGTATVAEAEALWDAHKASAGADRRLRSQFGS
ncbi:MAG: gamma-glutamylcyclotransferase family protein [Alphaproteobacteria bacterium]